MPGDFLVRKLDNTFGGLLGLTEVGRTGAADLTAPHLLVRRPVIPEELYSQMQEEEHQ